MKLTKGQSKFYNEFIANFNELRSTGLNKKYLVLTGYSGTGKTTLLCELVKEALNIGLEVACTAPTHKATHIIKNTIKESVGESVESVINFRTIHSFLSLKQVYNYSAESMYVLKRDTTTLKSRAHILFIDEVSMLSKELFAYVEEGVNDGSIGLVVMIGDPAQLKPVDGEFIDIFFKADGLTEVVRQAADNPIINLATKIRESITNGVPLPQGTVKNSVDDKFIFKVGQSEVIEHFVNNPSDDKVFLSFTNKSVDNFNIAVRKRLFGEDVEFLQDGDVVIMQRPVVVGNEVIYTNGEYVQVENVKIVNVRGFKCYSTGSRITVLHPDSDADYEEAVAKLLEKAKETNNKNDWGRYYNLVEMFNPVKHVYASTIHKSQGSTYEEVYVNLRDIDKRTPMQDIYRLLYVAFTRTSNRLYII